MKTLVDTLWYLDPHWDKFLSRSITCPEFDEFCGFNNWKKMKIKEPQVIESILQQFIIEEYVLVFYQY